MVNGDPATYPAVTGTVTGTPSTWIIPASEGPAPPLRASTGPSSRTPRLCSSVSSRPRSGVTGTVAIRIPLDRTFPQLWKTDVHQRKAESSSGLPTLSRLPSLPLEVGAEPGDRPAPPRLVVEGARVLDLAAAVRVAGRGVEPDLLEAVEGTAGGGVGLDEDVERGAAAEVHLEEAVAGPIRGPAAMEDHPGVAAIARLGDEHQAAAALERGEDLAVAHAEGGADDEAEVEVVAGQPDAREQGVEGLGGVGIGGGERLDGGMGAELVGEGADHHPGALVEVGANHHHGVEAGLVLPPAADQGCDLVVGHPSSPACTIFNALFPIMHTTGGGAQCASASSRRPRAAAA